MCEICKRVKLISLVIGLVEQIELNNFKEKDGYELKNYSSYVKLKEFIEHY